MRNRICTTGLAGVLALSAAIGAPVFGQAPSGERPDPRTDAQERTTESDPNVQRDQAKDAGPSEQAQRRETTRRVEVVDEVWEYRPMRILGIDLPFFGLHIRRNPSRVIVDAPFVHVDTGPSEVPYARPPAWLGVGLATVPAPLAEHLPDFLAPGQGALVTHVVPGSPAEASGLAENAVVISYNGESIGSPQHLISRLRSDRPGDEVTLGVVQGGRFQELHAVLGPNRPGDRAGKAGEPAQNSAQSGEVLPSDPPPRPRPAPSSDTPAEARSDTGRNESGSNAPRPDPKANGEVPAPAEDRRQP